MFSNGQAQTVWLGWRTWLALVQVAALARLARALGHQDVEIARLADLAETAGRAAHAAAGQRAAFAWRRVALDQYRVLGAAWRELHLTACL